MYKYGTSDAEPPIWYKVQIDPKSGPELEVCRKYFKEGLESKAEKCAKLKNVHEKLRAAYGIDRPPTPSWYKGFLYIPDDPK